MKGYNYIAKKVLILMILMACVGAVHFIANSETVLARPCCQSCPGWDGDEILYCEAQCGGTIDSTKRGVQACITECLQAAQNCLRTCYYCHGGGGGGGENCSGGCPIGTYCAADNTCHPF